MANAEAAEQILNALRARVDAAVKENFGYGPDDPLFDELLEQMRSAEAALREISPERYAIYAKKHY